MFQNQSIFILGPEVGGSIIILPSLKDNFINSLKTVYRKWGVVFYYPFR